ncbi:MAG: SpoIIE family protein phosphatase [Actinomycetota bacterium]|nr:SpoIIE family protein phosphatase [Actinomycetota bacterium]
MTALTARLFSGHESEVVELLDTLGEAITIRDETDTLVYANRAALRHLGFESLAELQEQSLPALMDEYVVHDEHGRRLSIEDIPSVRLLHGETPEPLLIHSVHRATGEARWELLKAAVLRDTRGQPSIAVTVIEDLTAVKTAEVHMRLLSESGRIFASSLDPEQTLRNVAEVAVPDLADWCIVDLLDPQGRPHHVASAHRDPERRTLVEALRQADRDELDGDSIVGQVISTGDARLLADGTDERLGALGHSAHGRQGPELAIRSAIVAPMRIRARTIGVMTFGTSESRRELRDEDLDVAVQLAGRAAVALENSRLQATLTGISDTLQQSLLPRALPKIPGWEIAALYRPAGRDQRIEVGGDFYEVIPTDSAALALIGDVTGHGVTAAALTASMRAGARFASRLEPHPAAILERLDEELRQRTGTTLCTALCARLAEGEMVLSSAGHPPALLADQAGQVSEVNSSGPLLGAFADARWREESVSVSPGELVLLYTDGVTETMGIAERFGALRLKRLLSELAGAPPQRLLDALDAALSDFRDGEPADDVAALALRPLPS